MYACYVCWQVLKSGMCVDACVYIQVVCAYMCVGVLCGYAFRVCVGLVCVCVC